MNSTQYSKYDLHRQRQRLEALVQPQSSFALRPALHHLGHALLAWLAPGNGPRLRQHWQNGTAHWTAYDPVTNQTQRFSSQDDLRSWLERRYYE